jgi:hypothetical protein
MPKDFDCAVNILKFERQQAAVFASMAHAKGCSRLREFFQSTLVLYIQYSADRTGKDTKNNQKRCFVGSHFDYRCRWSGGFD